MRLETSFVADSANNAVKEIVAVNGVVSSTSTINILGSGFAFPDGVAVDASGNVYVSDYGNQAVKEIVAVNGVVSSASTVVTLGSSFRPCGVSVDSGANVYVADCGNNAVEEILASGGYSTVKTLGSGFSGPTGVAVDARGNVYVADQSNNAVKEIMAVNGVVSSTSTVNTLGGFSNPADVAVDKSGNVYVADPNSNAVFEMLAVGGSVPASPTVLAMGTGFIRPYGVATTATLDVYVADTSNNGVKEIMTQGVNFGSVAIGTSTPLTLSLTFTFDTAGTIGAPAVLTQGAAGLDFTDAGTGTCTTNGTAYDYNPGYTCTLTVSFTPRFSGIRYGAATLSSGSGVIATSYLYGVGTGPQITFNPAAQRSLGSGFFDPTGIAVDGSGNLFVGDSGNQAVKEVPAGNGAPIDLATGQINYPVGVALDARGNIFVTDFIANAVKEILAAGGYTTVHTLGSGFFHPYGVAIDGSGNVFVGDAGHNAVKEILASSGYTTVLTLATGLGSSNNYGVGSTVALDANGNVYIASFGDGTVKEMPFASGYTAINTLATNLGEPTGVSVDAAGDVYVANYAGAPEEILAVNGSVSASGATVMTLGTLNQGGSLSNSSGVTRDSSGNVYITTARFGSVQELGFASIPTMSFATPTAAGTTDTTDGALSAILSNEGNATLTAIAPGLSVSANFSQVSGSGTPTDCSSSFTLAEGARCNLSIEFAPVASANGTINGSLVLTDNNLNAAAPGYTTQSIALSGTGIPTPTISFTVPNHTFGDAPFTVSATSNSTGVFTYSVVSGPATISGSTVTLTGAGTVVLQASEAADTNYSADTKNATFNVAAGTPTISFTVSNHTYGDAPFTVNATSNSTGVFTYSVVSGPATISGSTVTLTGAGTVLLQASEAADSNHSADIKNATFNVATGTPTISFTVSSHTYGDAPFTVSATSNSTGAFTYSVVSGPATISGSTITLTGAGTVLLQSSEAASGNYAAAAVNATFTVAVSIGVSTGSGTGSSAGTVTVAPGGAAIFSLMFTPGGAATYPDALSFSTTGLPPGAIATFSPATIPAGSPATPVTLTLQTSNSQTAYNEKPSSGRRLPSIAWGFLLLPLAGLKRLRQIRRLLLVALVTALSLGAVLGLSSCSRQSGFLSKAAQSYNVQVIATDMKTGASVSATVILIVQ